MRARLKKSFIFPRFVPPSFGISRGYGHSPPPPKRCSNSMQRSYNTDGGRTQIYPTTGEKEKRSIIGDLLTLHCTVRTVQSSCAMRTSRMCIARGSSFVDIILLFWPSGACLELPGLFWRPIFIPIFFFVFFRPNGICKEIKWILKNYENNCSYSSVQLLHSIYGLIDWLNSWCPAFLIKEGNTSNSNWRMSNWL